MNLQVTDGSLTFYPVPSRCQNLNLGHDQTPAELMIFTFTLAVLTCEYANVKCGKYKPAKHQTVSMLMC